MGYYFEQLQALELLPRHKCCEECEDNLFPPRRAGEFGTLIKYKTTAFEHWYLMFGDNIHVNYCPWCGIKLPAAES